jgi:hypothetical protein
MIMKFVVKLAIVACTLALISSSLFAEEGIQNNEASSASASASGRATPLTQEEVDASIGRYGEVDEIPEDFKFNDAEILLWHGDHLANIKKPLSLYYEFVKSGSLEGGFTDSIYLKILELNEDGSKNAMLDFFTAEKQQVVTPDNVTNITGNPILGIYMQGDVYEMNRLTEGHWRHFQKSIKISLREDAIVEPTIFTFNGKEYKGRKMSFSPYLNDPHRRDFEKYAEKSYEFIFSDDIPGSLYQITTIIPDKSKESAEPLLLETITLVDVMDK